MKKFDEIRAIHELGKSFGQLDIYMAEVRNTELDNPTLYPQIIARLDQAVANAPVRALGEHLDREDGPGTKEDYMDIWEDLKEDFREDVLRERLDSIDPLTREGAAAISAEQDLWERGLATHRPSRERDPGDTSSSEALGEGLGAVERGHARASLDSVVRDWWDTGRVPSEEWER